MTTLVSPARIGTLAVLISLVGCARVFGLEPPQREPSDGAADVATVDSWQDGAATVGDSGAIACTGGTCDDLNACTSYDTCIGDTCHAIDNLCPSTCSTVCNSTCGGDTCCQQACTGGACPTCPSGCSCDQNCGTSRPCTGECSTGASCKIFGSGAEPDGNYQVTCRSGSFCVVDCFGDQGSCVVTCEAGASCMVIDRMLAAATTLTCSGGAVTCPGNVQVCNRSCP